MSFISYAQNFEDVMLWRALKHIETGFYIDVGANDPETDSVTRAFYELGWRGINIEPVSQWFQRLQETRERDINLQLALGSQRGDITLYEIPDTGLSTAEKAFAERHEAERGYQSRELKVTQETLAEICEQYHIAPIHFLKIDVEGMEKAVLEGADFNKIRPWVVLIESMVPNRQEESYSDWEPILLNTGYQFAYHDGINRFYVAEEHAGLMDAFRYPPNVFDDFVLKKHLEAESRAEQAETKAREAESRAEQAETTAREAESRAEQAETKAREAESRAEQAETKAREAEAYSTALLNSRSWRITAPIRALRRIVRSAGPSSIRFRVKVCLQHAELYIRRRPRLKRLVLKIIARFPRLRNRLALIARQPIVVDHRNHRQVPLELEHLTPRARQIYSDLKIAMEQTRKHQ